MRQSDSAPPHERAPREGALDPLSQNDRQDSAPLRLALDGTRRTVLDGGARHQLGRLTDPTLPRTSKPERRD